MEEQKPVVQKRRRGKKKPTAAFQKEKKSTPLSLTCRHLRGGFEMFSLVFEAQEYCRPPLLVQTSLGSGGSFPWQQQLQSAFSSPPTTLSAPHHVTYQNTSDLMTDPMDTITVIQSMSECEIYFGFDLPNNFGLGSRSLSSISSSLSLWK